MSWSEMRVECADLRDCWTCAPGIGPYIYLIIGFHMLDPGFNATTRSPTEVSMVNDSSQQSNLRYLASGNAHETMT